MKNLIKFKLKKGFGDKNGKSSANNTNKASDWVVVDDNDNDGFSSISTSSFGHNSSSATTQGPSSIHSTDYSKSSSKYSSNTTTSSSSSSTANNGEATKRFANAKSISSAQYFGNESGMSESDIHHEKLNRFQGSSSISSEDYFGDGKTKPRSSYSSNNNTPDISVIKQDLKEGVTKMAGKLSNMASNVMSSFQVINRKIIFFGCIYSTPRVLATLP